MSGTQMIFQANATYAGRGVGKISGSGTGTLNAPFPSATSAKGVWSGTISDPLGTRNFSLTWTATRVSGGGKPVPQEDFDFDVDVNPHVLSIMQDQEITVSVTITLTRGRPQSVRLTVTNWESADITARLADSVLSPTEAGNRTTLHIKTTCNTRIENYLFTVRGESQGTLRTSMDSVNLEVKANPDCPSTPKPEPKSSDENKRLYFDRVGDEWEPRTISIPLAIP